MWDVFSEKMTFSERIHKGEVENMTLDPLNHNLVTNGADKLITSRDLNGAKTKSAQYKEAFFHVSNFNHSRAQGHSILYTNKDKSSVFYSNIDQNSKPVQMFSIQNDNKKSKITDLTLHPINHNIIFVELNGESLYVYYYDPYHPPNLAIAKRVIYWEDQSHIKSNIFEEKTNSLVLSSSVISKVGPWNTSERVVLSVSCSGTLVAAFSNASSKVAIFDLNAKGKMIVEENVKSFCWSKTQDKFAILIQLEDSVTVKGSFRSKKVVNVISGHDLQISQVVRESNGEAKIQNLVKSVEKKKEIDYVIEGFLLGVVYCATEKSASSLQFFSWNGNPIGHVFPQPSFVLWHPDFLYCLIVFPERLAIYKTSPSFKLVCSHEITITSAHWFYHSIFFTTEDKIGMSIKYFFFLKLKIIF